MKLRISTAGSPVYEGLLELMSKFLSVPTVEATLDVVLRTRYLSPCALRQEDLATTAPTGGRRQRLGVAVRSSQTVERAAGPEKQRIHHFYLLRICHGAIMCL